MKTFLLAFSVVVLGTIWMAGCSGQEHDLEDDELPIDEVSEILSADVLQQEWMLVNKSYLGVLNLKKAGKAICVLHTPTRGVVQLEGQWKREKTSLTVKLTCQKFPQEANVDEIKLHLNAHPEEASGWQSTGKLIETYTGGGDNDFQTNFVVLPRNEFENRLAQLHVKNFENKSQAEVDGKK